MPSSDEAFTGSTGEPPFVQGSWQPDPGGGHQWRFQDVDGTWTDSVADGSVISSDPLPGGSTAPELPPPPSSPKAHKAKKPVWRRWWAFVAYALIVLAVIGSLSGGGNQVANTDDLPSQPAASTSQPRVRDTPSAELSTEAAPVTSTAPEPAIEIIESGTYLVPSEFEPGVYRVSGYWARLDSELEIIDNDIVSENGLGLLVVGPSDSYVEISGEAASLDEVPVVDPLLMGFTEGTYIVGVDMRPGRYRVSDPEYAYAARLDRSLSLIDNEGNSGSVIIVVKSTDFAFSFSGALSAI